MTNTRAIPFLSCWQSLSAFFFLALFSFSEIYVSGQTAVVSTSFGPVAGNCVSGIFEFRGIPFATPPVGEYRWKLPLAPESWTDPLSAQEFKPACPQKLFQQGDTVGVVIGEEDCLYLNVWTPDTASSTLPVLVFIHGGGNQQGSAGQVSMGTEMYDGKNLAQRGNAVVVTIQYRLGPLGYLVHPGLEAETASRTSGNYGVMDQLLALHWIKSNISSFGGDTTKVMVFGESAGGVNTGNLLVTPLAAGLFQRACIESAAPAIGSYETEREKGIDFVDGLAPSGSDSVKIACLRSLPADSLVAGEQPPLNGGFVQLSWRPVVDGQIFSGFPEDIIQSGNFNHMPLMIGSNADEVSLTAPAVVYPFMVTALINAYLPASLRDQALALYPPGTTAEEARQSYIQLLTDAQFTTPVRRTAQCTGLNQTEPVYRYFFTHKHAGPLEVYGSYHGMELFYVFNNWENTNYAVGPWFSPQDDSTQTNLLHYWVNFAATGDPNGSNVPVWPVNNPDTDCYCELKATPDGTQCGLRTEKCDLWDMAAGYSGCTSSQDVLDREKPKLILFPNPTTGIFRLFVPGGLNSWDIRIFDLSGKQVKRFHCNDRLTVEDLPDGIYILKAIRSGEVITTKLLKMH